MPSRLLSRLVPILSCCLPALVIGVPVRAAEAPALAEPVARWDGAVGLLAAWGPEYPGADDLRTAFKPAVFLRYKRLSISSGAGFAVRRDDDLFRGLGLDLTRREDLRVSLGLRYDNGRSEDDSPSLAGMGDVRHTVRARVGLQWKPQPRWRVSASWTVDAFGRGGGNLLELGAVRELRVSPFTQFEFGARAALGGRQYMQTYFGVDPAQSARTGRPEFHPGTGWRDAALFVGMRHELDASWVLQAGASVTQLVGGAADSPLTRRATALGLSAGLAYRF